MFLSFDLNCFVLVTERIVGGSLFHARGAATRYALSPIFSLVRGTYRSVDWAERSDERPGSCDTNVRQLLRYGGARPPTARCTIKHNLYSIRCRIGSQCNSRKAVVRWSRGFRSSTSRAAAFSTRCNGASDLSGRPASTTLQ